MDSGVAISLSWKGELKQVNIPSKWRVKDPIQNLSCRSKGEKIATNPPRTLKPAISSHMTVEKQVFQRILSILAKDTTRRIVKQSIEPLATWKDVLAHFPHKKFNPFGKRDLTEKLPSSELFPNEGVMRARRKKGYSPQLLQEIWFEPNREITKIKASIQINKLIKIKQLRPPDHWIEGSLIEIPR
ncbi:hypothetical protein F8388_022808 [Cannabis sativa]|uniref:Uncharacterized protein n=1 Tax=Cannabis sativa TaxID=3483 RepID=A0A7J6FC09_CANSA|nr:hypothetical protein F8388_022808 [Cannabis sativa]